MRSLPLAGFVLLPLLSVACSSSGDDGATSDLALVTTLGCSIARASFVAASTAPNGNLAVTCPGVRGVLINGAVVPGDNLTSFTVKPHEGINILHVEQGDGNAATATDIPFMFGAYKDPNAMVDGGIALRVNAPGLSDNGQIVLPIPTPSAINLSQVGTQILRDKGNVLGALDGTGLDASGIGFEAGVRIVHSSYDPSNITVILTPRAGGVHVDAVIHSVSTQIAWDAGVTLITFQDQVTASIDMVHVSADLDLKVDRGSGKILASLGQAHEVHVDGVQLDSAALDRIPLIASGVEPALANGAETLANQLADPLLAVVRDTLAPAIAVGLEQLKLPSTVTIPVLGGTLGIAEKIDGATFDDQGLALSLAAKVTAPTPNPAVPSAPGFLTRPTKPASFASATGSPFAASISFDYLNEALYAAWKQGVLNRDVSALVSGFGLATGPVTSEAKMPPVVFPSADGKGLLLNLGEFELTTTFLDAKIKIAVSLQAGVNVALGPGGDTIVLSPTHDELNTHLITELIAVEQGHEAQAADIASALQTFGPVLEATIADDLALPPIPMPGIDLGMVSPGLAGKKGGFDGALHFDADASRLSVEGKLTAK